MSHETKPIDSATRSRLFTIESGMWDFVDPFITPIGLVTPEDPRDLPGKHHGTGTLCLFNQNRYVVTCWHVANISHLAKLTYAPFGAESALAVVNPFKAEPSPVDVAASVLSNRSWELVAHNAQCVPMHLLAERHCPVDGEFLYVHGFPTADAGAAFGTHHARGLAFITQECAYDQVLELEFEKIIEGFHICVSTNPAFATQLTNSSFGLPQKLSGMSGSFVWNTRYKELSDQGVEWRPESSRITALVWAESQKAGALIATPIQYMREFLRRLP